MDDLTTFEQQLKATAAAFPYPNTPDVAAAVRRRLAVQQPQSLRRAVAVGLAIVLALASLLLVPQVRAAVLEFFQIGAIKVEVVESTPTPAAVPHTIWDVSEPVSLGEAIDRFPYPLQLPSTLGPPDAVRLRRGRDGEQAVIFLWGNTAAPDIALYQVSGFSFGLKMLARDAIDQLLIDGEPAFWLEGEHPLFLTDGEFPAVRIESGNVLLWYGRNVTYRLEGNLTLAEALALVDSFKEFKKSSS